ncbi:tetratricopeptide repeat protein 16 [Bufo gargarizans]|uniref:tetratricopeptide repeat protein 16 n=1 Tax=Bufo gargarizans TaxID=30331 RepID=UPI001CF33F6E|nr:tetratricopeptide repeat protein 16 [Bufo gargarizans]
MEKTMAETCSPELEEMTGDMFPTAVSEEKLQEARRKSLKKIFGSSEVFLDVHGKSGQRTEQTYEDIVQGKAAEHYQGGLQYLAQKEWEKAVIAFSKAIYLWPEKVELYVKRAEAFLQLRDFQRAALNLKKACSIGPPVREHIELLALTYNLQGQSLFDQNCHLDAFESFTRAAELQPQNSHYHMRSISCLAALGRYAECLQLLNKQLEEEQGNPDIYVLRARLYDQLNKATFCYQDIHSALSLDPQHQEALGLRDKMIATAEEAKDKAVNLAVQGQLQDALKKISFAIENNPLSAEYHIFRGTVYRKLSDFSSAVDDFVRAMQLCNAEGISGSEGMNLYTEAENQLLLTYNDFAVHCYMKGFYQEGALLLNKALNGDRTKKELYMNRGDCFFQLGELAFALADYQQAFELDEEDWGIRTRIAKLLDEIGLQAQSQKQYQQAERHFSEAIMKHPLLPQLYLHRAKVRRSVQNATGAQEDAVISVLLNPKSEETAPTIMSFFPGKTLHEILASKLASSTRCVLGQNRKTLGYPVTWKDGTQSTREEMDGAIPGTRRDLAICMTDQQVAEMVIRRRKLKSDIQAALNRQGYLRSTAPRIAGPPQPQEEAPAAQTPYHWKTFGLGLMSTR